MQPVLLCFLLLYKSSQQIHVCAYLHIPPGVAQGKQPWLIWVKQPIHNHEYHYSGVIMSTMASQITSVSIVYSTVGSGADQRKHQRSASLAFMRWVHRWPVNSPHKGPVTLIFVFHLITSLWQTFSRVTPLALWHMDDDSVPGKSQ